MEATEAQDSHELLWLVSQLRLSRAQSMTRVQCCQVVIDRIDISQCAMVFSSAFNSYIRRASMGIQHAS